MPPRESGACAAFGFGACTEPHNLDDNTAPAGRHRPYGGIAALPNGGRIPPIDVRRGTVRCGHRKRFGGRAREAAVRARRGHQMGKKPELLERLDTEHAIGEALRGAARGDGGTVALSGTPGIGKTAMLGWASTLAAARGFAVAHAVASPMERGLPFGLLGQAIVALGGNPVEDVAELARAGGQSARFYRTLRWLGEAAATTPVLFALDDLHWADPDSLELLGFLCRRLAGLRVLVIGTLRAEPPPAQTLVCELAGERARRRRSRSSRSAARAPPTLLERVLGHSLAQEQATELWRDCAGTPLLLEAVGRSLAEGRPPRQAGDAATGDAALLLARFVDVDGDGFEYVKAGAIFGVFFDHAKATALSGVPAAAAETRSSGWSAPACSRTSAAGAVAFVHPLFAQALLDAQPSALRERRHAAAFELVVAQGGPDALAAEHAALAGLPGDPLAVEITARAGAAALAQGALRAACTHLENAVRLAGANPPTEVLLLYGQVLVAQAQIEPLRALCAELLSRELDAPTRARALCLLARVEALANRPAQAQQLFMQAAAVATDRERSRRRALRRAADLPGLGARPLGARHRRPRARAGRRPLAPAAGAALRPRLRRADLPLRPARGARGGR